jgi:hypothetical protein
LTPAQQTVTSRLPGGLRAGGTLVLKCAAGRGKTTIPRKIHRSAGGVLPGHRDFLDAIPYNRRGADRGFVHSKQSTICSKISAGFIS